MAKSHSMTIGIKAYIIGCLLTSVGVTTQEKLCAIRASVCGCMWLGSMSTRTSAASPLFKLPASEYFVVVQHGDAEANAEGRAFLTAACWLKQVLYVPPAVRNRDSLPDPCWLPSSVLVFPWLAMFILV